MSSAAEAPVDPRQRLLETTIDGWIAHHAESRPSHLAFVCDDGRVTWADFDARVSRVANALGAIGIAKNDKVALLAPNGIEAVEVLFGTLRAGAVIVPLSTMLPADVLLREIHDSGAGALVVADPALAADLSAAVRANCRPIAVGFKSAGFSDYEALLAAASERRPDVALEPGDDCNIIYSSGTTNDPKGIVHTHLSRMLFGFGLSVQLRVDGSAITLLATPLFTNGSWMTLLPTVGLGGTTVLMRSFSARSWLDCVERERCTHGFMVPTQFELVLADHSLANRDLSSLRIVVSSGSRLPPATKRAVLKRMTRGLMELYGMTEGIGTALEPEDMELKITSVGRPLGTTEILIIDEQDNVLPAGQAGEIVGYSPAIMRAYHDKPSETAALGWHAPDGRRFIRTGDIGRLDEDGFLYILDRKKDMILSGGINVYASDLEQVFAAHPDVAEVAVIAVPHEKWGETPLVLVVLRDGASASPEEIRAWGNQRLGKHQRASRLELRQTLPRNALGKVLKRELRAPYW